VKGISLKIDDELAARVTRQRFRTGISLTRMVIDGLTDRLTELEREDQQVETQDK
jgi:hypothetical protein